MGGALSESEACDARPRRARLKSPNGYCSRLSTPSSKPARERFMNAPAQKSVAEAQPLIAVRDVRASSRWYADLLGADALPDHPHRDVYDRIWRAGRLLLQLHAWDAEE